MNDSNVLIMLAAIISINRFHPLQRIPLVQPKNWKQKIYIRMIIGGIFGGVSFFSVSYLWAWLNNNINPVSGLGMMVIGAFGIVVGALLGAINTQKNNSKNVRN